jgi:DNA-binding transcriptional LysR family regulator
MDHTSLQIFCIVARELSITRAAKRLNRVQSNVTTRIQQLEEGLGVALFRRDGNRLSLSAEGERFLDYADRMLALAEEARQVLKPQAPSGALQVGAMESTAASRLPKPLALYHRRWPQVQLKISTGPSRSLLERVSNGLLDCAFVAIPTCSNREPQAELGELGLTGEPIFKEELLMLLPPGHRPIRKPADVAVHSLAAFPSGCTYRAIAEDWLGHNSPALEIQEVSSYHLMFALVASGTCICLLPRSVLQLLPKPSAIQTHAINEADTWLVWRNGYETAAFAALREILAQSSGRPATQ